MSACISRHGEYSEHTPDGEYTCQRCLVLDEDALRAELRRLRAEPTDAQVIAAATAFENRWNEGVQAAEGGVVDDPDAFIQQAMRAALRAVWNEENAEDGESR